MREQIEKLVQEELDRANAKFPQFASRHEGYAVLLEEVEEAAEELEKIKIRLKNIWGVIRGIENKQVEDEFALDIEYCALNLIEESIQVAAMSKKYQSLLPSLTKP